MNNDDFAKAMEEYNESLRALREVIREFRQQSIATNDAMNKVVNSSHLRSMLTLQTEDIGFRRVLELQNHNQP